MERMPQMKNNGAKKRLLTAGAAALALCAFAFFYAQAGTGDDPIALKSYVDAKISALEAKISAAGSGATAGQGDSATGADAAALEALTKEVAQLKQDNAQLQASVQSLQTQAASGAAGGGSSGGGATDVAASSGAAGGAQSSALFVVLEMQEGQRLFLGAGAEVVLRTGAAQAIHGTLGPVVDLITGEELAAGADIARNHLILSSRDDNRGILVTESSYVLVKGGYTIR